MQTIVISAVNLRKGGTLTILRQCLEYLSSVAVEKHWRVVALVHQQDLANFPNIEYIEMPYSVQSWVSRLRCEHFEMKKATAHLGEIDLWLSLHDTTPTIQAKRRAVYCHNSFPFLKWKWRHLLQNWGIVTFAALTKHIIYRPNIHKNDYLIVQQEWFRKAMHKMFRYPQERIIVSLPTTHHQPIAPKTVPTAKYHFIFAAYHDINKNFECLCEAARLLEEEMGTEAFEVTLTISQEDSKYAKWLAKKWGNVTSIRFAGFQNKDNLYQLYQQADCLVFPSLVETWGLPISEFAVSGKPMLLANLPYAHETAAGYSKAAFFNPNSPEQLKQQMKALIQGDTTILSTVPKVSISEPLAHSWEEVFAILLK